MFDNLVDAIVDQLKDVPHPKRSSDIPAFFSLLMGRIPEPHLENPVFQDPEGSEKPFAPHYERFIKPEIQAFEHKRIATLKSFSQRFSGGWRLLGAVVIMGIVFPVFRDLLWIIFPAIVAWCYLPISRYNDSIKKTIFPHIFSFFGDDFRYAPESLVGIETLEPSAILPAYDKAVLSDSIRGSHHGVTLDILWAHLIKVSVRDFIQGSHHGGTLDILWSHLRKGSNEEEGNIFKGIFVCLNMNKWFSGKTIVKRDRGLLMNWAIKKPEGLEKVSLEDPRFEKDFEVYASNQIEARYLLTPSFMERLQGLSDLFGKTDIQASFYNQNLLLMIPLTKRYFDTGSIFQPATFTEEIQSILEEMNLIFKIIEELKLHEKTGV
jgi:hypothetical protein